MAVARLSSDQPAPEVYSHGHVQERLEFWRQQLVAHDGGHTNNTTTRAEILGALDRWLDELSDLRGR
jgi:hypothetical protein